MTIGQPIRRVEDRPLLSGSATFVDDLELPEMVHARFLRSPAPHAEIEHLDLRAARALDGVHAALGATDLDLPPLQAPIANPLARTPSRPLLATRTVRFVGEPVAVVVAESPYLAEDAIGSIELGLTPLPVVRDPMDVESQPAIHGAGHNVLYDNREEIGDVERAFNGAAVVIERSFRNPRSAAMPMEPRGVVAAPEDGGVRIWSSSQIPHKLAQVTAEVLSLKPDQVRVTIPEVGGGFGQKAHAYPEELLVAWLALRLNRPVKWIEDRTENLVAASHARDQLVRARAAADGDGRLLALDVDVTCDIGAYPVYPHGHILEALGTPAMIPGPYRLRDYRLRSRAIATNKCPEGAYRGVGLPVSALVHERLMDLLAGELGLDRAEIRRRNLLTREELPYTTVTHQRYDSGDYPLALEQALQAIGYEEFSEEQRRGREQRRLLGLGMASYVEYAGMGSAVFHGRGMVGIAGVDRAWLSLDENGTVTVSTTLPGIGQGVATTFAQLTAEGMGVHPAAVRVLQPDTSANPGEGTGTFASRTAVVGGGAIRAGAAELIQRLLQAASEQLEVSIDDLELRSGHVGVRGSPGRQLSFAQLRNSDPERFRVEGVFDPERVAYPYATHACVVEVDAETGAVKLLRYVVAEDCGRIINPLIVEGQAHGAVAQGIGGALYEAVIYDEAGQPVTGSLMDFLVPTATELVSMQLTHLEIPAPDSPTGAKGVGEGGTLAPGPAIANAVSDALGVEFNDLPLTPERVRAGLRESPYRNRF